ncbi:MAG: hypothetical protein KDA61_16465 [Planctomycetales bacterium]|nr:hypothetical protein [Planctomycetales bacterium]MCB9488714.1 hypothetical protein [Deltaproteobacteria bacterium]
MAHIPAVIASEAPNAPTSSVAWMRAATFGVVAFLASATLAQLLLDPALGSPAYRVFQHLRILEMMAVIGMAWSLRRRFATTSDAGRAAATCIAMGLTVSLLGDLINGRIIDLAGYTPNYKLFTVPVFAVAHIFYIVAFQRLTSRLLAGDTRRRLTLAAWPVLALGLWAVAVSDNPDPLIRHATIGYAFIVVGMTIASLWVVFAFGAAGRDAVAGAVLFLISDVLLGAYLPEPPAGIGLVIWGAYLLGQLLLARTILLAERVPAVTVSTRNRS